MCVFVCNLYGTRTVKNLTTEKYLEKINKRQIDLCVCVCNMQMTLCVIWLAAGHRRPWPLRDEGGASRGQEVWGRRHRDGEPSHSGEDPQEPETGPLKCKNTRQMRCFTPTLPEDGVTVGLSSPFRSATNQTSFPPIRQSSLSLQSILWMFKLNLYPYNYVKVTSDVSLWLMVIFRNQMYA